MSRYRDNEPVASTGDDSAIDLVIESRPRDLGGFSVRRTLPSPLRRLIGPFIFFDHFGPADFAQGGGIDVRPHPHIALATISYLFEGELVHRDSLGTTQTIRPGDVNWMVAGRGIVHSERTSPELRARGFRIQGLQTWVALPENKEEVAPHFEHHPGKSIPVVARRGATLRVIAGTAYGAASPTAVLSPTLYVHAKLEQGAVLDVDEEHDERAVYVVDGEIECDQRTFANGNMIILRPGKRVSVHAKGAANIMLVGGGTLGGLRHIFWNFVSSSKERIEQAKSDWREGRFPKVPGDEKEFIPLPDE